MRTFIIGSKKLSVDILKTLLEQGHEVLGVFSRDDEPGMKTWHEQLGHPSLKQEATDCGIPAYEGMRVNTEEARALLRSLDLDIVFSCFWSELFKKETLDIPRLGVFNFHTAHLPKNRGSRPIPWAIIHGESFTGLTIHKMAEGVDNGPVVDQVKVDIAADDTGQRLYERVTEAGAELFRRTLPSFANGQFTLTAQDEASSTYHPRGEPYGGQVNAYWDDRAKDRFRRAFHFPPFRAHREAPAPALDSSGQPGIYLVMDDDPLPGFALPDEGLALVKDSIGTAAERKWLKGFFQPLADLSIPHKGCLVNTGEQGLKGMYAVHDVLRQLKASFVVSRFHTNVEVLEQWPFPFRYENGLLEIPSFVVGGEDTSLVLLREHAEKLLHQYQRDVFIPVVIENAKNARQICDRLSKEFQKSGGRILPFAEVCEHYDTEYQ